MPKGISIVLVSLWLLGSALPAAAQTPTPAGPIYVVRAGETLTQIAQRFNVSIDALMAANNIANPNLLSSGQRLVIPGLEGITGILDTEIVGFGDSFRSLVRRTQIPPDLLLKLNHVVSPTEFYVGATMIVPKQQNVADLTNRTSLASGKSLLEAAVEFGTDAWSLAALNGLGGTWDGLPGDNFYAPGAGPAQQSAAGLPPNLISAEIPTLPFKQGGTAEIVVEPAQGVTLSGSLGTYLLHFFPMGDRRMVALQGLHAMLQPGVYPLQLDATSADGTLQSFQQLVLVASGGFAREALSVPAETIDPAVTGPEDQQVLGITAPATAQKFWAAAFSPPVDSINAECIKDRFGTRRSFNGSDYTYFHSGVDYGICSVAHPFDIYAAAPGIVVFASQLNVRGNATFIDHGWGVYTGYFHQAEIYVKVGQQVQAGQLIGKIGQTGRVTGPHLHFDLWVNGVQVNPLDWLAQVYP
jgi:murein DD-endopeptidase MepM/ murein hydrolase activator NlpD